MTLHLNASTTMIRISLKVPTQYKTICTVLTSEGISETNKKSAVNIDMKGNYSCFKQ